MTIAAHSLGDNPCRPRHFKPPPCAPVIPEGPARKALEALKTLKTRYPESEYARDADNRMRIVQDNIAASEMEVGRYYLNQHNYIGAINRFKTVVSEYQTTAHVEEALYRLTVAYLSLGIAPEAQNAAAVLGHNFPNSSWYKESYALLQKQGLMPQASQGSWMTDVLKAPAKAPAAPPTAKAKPVPTPDWTPATTKEEPKAPPGPPPPLSLGGPQT